MLAPIHGASILLVEDNIFSQQVGQELLEDAGATVVVANNGKEAIDLLMKEHFDCVLMDVQMPVMDGYEATRIIRGHPKLSGTLIIAMTANAGREDQARCLAAGMDEFVTKPIAPNLLFSVLSKWMSQRAAEGRMAQVRSTTTPGQPPQAAPAPEPMPDAVAAQDADADAGAGGNGESELFDLRALAQTFGNKPEKMRKYANMFIDSAQDGLREVQAALAAGDLVRLSELGHRIKSSARAVGAMSFADLCLALEKMTPADGIERARSIVSQMQPLLDRLREHIAQEMNANIPG